MDSEIIGLEHDDRDITGRVDRSHVVSRVNAGAAPRVLVGRVALAVHQDFIAAW